RLYVAAGDAGLLTYDVSSFTAPFAVRSYPTGAMTSTAWVDGKLYASRSGGGISEFVKTQNTGYLTAARQWDAHVQTVYEGAGGFLLTSSGKTLYFWTLVSTTPTLITSADFASNIVSATVPVAASGTPAAVFTFTGINVVSSGASFTLPNSSSPIARRLAISGTELLELTDTSLVVWDLSSKKIIRTIPLPAAASSLAVD